MSRPSARVPPVEPVETPPLIEFVDERSEPTSIEITPDGSAVARPSPLELVERKADPLQSHAVGPDAVYLPRCQHQRMRDLNALQIALVVLFVVAALVTQYFIGQLGDKRESGTSRWIAPTIYIATVGIVVLVIQLPKRL